MVARKRMLILVMVFLGVAVCTTDSYAYEYKETNAVGKLIRGILNVVSSPFEILKHIYTEGHNENIVSGMTIGLGKGVIGALLRLGAGVVEILTFPLNFPDEYKDPIIPTEYAWEGWD